MKKLFLIFPLLVIISFTNCKKSKGPASVPSVQQDNGADSLLDMSVLINGVVWQTDSAFSYKIRQSGNDSNLVSLMIQATNKSTDTPVKTSTIVININNYTGPNTYVINPPAVSVVYYQGTTRFPSLPSATFNVTVVSDTGQLLRGTFSFDAFDVLSTSPTPPPIKFRSGTFTVALP